MRLRKAAVAGKTPATAMVSSAAPSADPVEIRIDRDITPESSIPSAIVMQLHIRASLA